VLHEASPTVATYAERVPGIAVGIFLVTLTLVIWQPRRLGIGWSALGGAALALLTGVVHLADLPVVVGIVWNATLAFVGIILISLVLDECGFFEWAALHVARWGRGHGVRLFVLIVLLGAVVAAFFANDGAALILTPIVVQILRVLHFSTRATIAFVMATGFIADAGSLPLLVSNLVNIVAADFFDISFARYALVMVPVGVVSVAASLGLLWLYYRRSIPARYHLSGLARPAEAITDRLTFRAGWLVLALLLVGYLLADPLDVPLSAVVGGGAVVLLAVAARRPAFAFRAGTHTGDGGAHRGSTRVAGPAHPIRVRTVVQQAPWQVVLFSLGMYVVVYGLRDQGLTAQLTRVFTSLSAHGVLVSALGVGFVVAVVASVLNNLPTVLVMVLAVTGVAAAGVTHEAMVYATVIGSDLGPKITPIGSLATLLWLDVLDRKGIHIGWGRYVRTGIVLTVPVLLVSLLALAGWLQVVGR